MQNAQKKSRLIQTQKYKRSLSKKSTKLTSRVNSIMTRLFNLE